MGELRLDVGSHGFGSGIVDKPAEGRHDVLIGHVIPACARFLTLVVVAVTVTEVEVGAERQVTLDGRTFGDEFRDTAESGKWKFGAHLFPVVAVVAHLRTVGRVTVATGESAFEQALVVGLGFHGVGTLVVAQESALSVFAPKADTGLVGLGVGVETGPSAVHRRNPHTRVETVC